MTTYVLNRHRFVMHRRNGERSRSGNRAHIKDPMLMHSWGEAARMVQAGAKVCHYCFPDGWPEADPEQS